jgi:hypothetical protein
MAFAQSFLKRLLRCAALLVVACVAVSYTSVARCQQPEPKPKVSSEPLSSDALAIYAVVLHGWMDGGKHPLNLSVLTTPLDEGESKGCTKLPMEKADSSVVHRFRQQDLVQLGSPTIHLVDPDVQDREVDKNDPGKAIRNGASVDDAIRNGFAHGLITLSEIRFDKVHQFAIVSFGFRCGALCGNGGTFLMQNFWGKWGVEKSCENWISTLRMTSAHIGAAAS